MKHLCTMHVIMVSLRCYSPYRFGADVNSKGNISGTTLHWACYNGLTEVAFGHGHCGRCGHKDNDTITPFTPGTNMAHTEIAKALARQGVHIF
jgi:hypothetical protein